MGKQGGWGAEYTGFWVASFFPLLECHLPQLGEYIKVVGSMAQSLFPALALKILLSLVAERTFPSSHCRPHPGPELQPPEAQLLAHHLQLVIRGL